MEKINAFLNGTFGTGLMNVVKAILLLALAFIVAAIVKKLVVALINKTKLKDVLGKADKEGDGSKIAEYIGKLVYLLVFLLFVPGIFGVLGASSVAAPILNVLESIWGYLPNILAAAIILVVGLLVAKLIRELLIPVFQKIKLDKLQEKAGIEVADSAKLSTTLAYIVYVLIVIPVVIIALKTLKIDAVSDPAIKALDQVVAYIPLLIVGILIIGAGVWVAKLAGSIITKLIAATGVDKKLSDRLDDKAKNLVLSKVIGIIVEALIIVFFVVQGLNILKLDVLTGIGATIIAYLPKIIASIIVIGLAITIASLISRFMEKNGIGRYAFIAKIAIYILAGFMVLTQLSIAKDIVFWAFVIILAAAAVAAAIAFGIGGRKFAEKTLDKLECKGGDADAAADEEAEDHAASIAQGIADSVDGGIDKFAGKFGKKDKE